jgi:predicted nucleic acid-binding protein
MKLFLDANILFSAAHSEDSHAYLLVRFAEAGYCVILGSPHAIGEATRNLELKSRDFHGRFARILRRIERVPEAPAELVQWAAAQGLPAKDAPILAAAAHARADLLVTGDRRHFGLIFGKILRGVHVATLGNAVELVVKSAIS